MIKLLLMSSVHMCVHVLACMCVCVCVCVCVREREADGDRGGTWREREIKINRDRGSGIENKFEFLSHTLSNIDPFSKKTRYFLS